MTLFKTSLICLVAATASSVALASSAPAMGRDTGGGKAIDYFPGIDCRKDHGPAIDTICESDRLMFLENKITQRYSEAAGRANKFHFAHLIEDQRTYLAERDACGRNRNCLENVLRSRLNSIE